MDIIIYSIFYVAGIITIGFSLYLFIKANKINSWLKCPGIVTEIITSITVDNKGFSHVVYGVKYRYRPTDREYYGESSLKGSWKVKYTVNSEIEVAYDPINHEKSDQFELFQQRLYLTLLIPGLFLIYFGYALSS